MSKDIQKGYQLIVNSSANSYAADMNTSSFEGLTLEKVKALKAFIDIVDSMSSYSYDSDFGNQVQRATNHLFTKENDLAEYSCSDLEGGLDAYEGYPPVSDLLYEVFGMVMNEEHYNTLDNYAVYFHTFDLPDISSNI